MNDTTTKMKDMYRVMLMKKSNEERMLMGFSMFETAKKIVLSTIPDTENRHIALFMRFYGNDFSPEICERIIARLA